MTQIPKIDDTPKNRFKLALYLSLLHKGVDRSSRPDQGGLGGQARNLQLLACEARWMDR